MKTLWTAAVVCMAVTAWAADVRAGADDWMEPDKLLPALKKAASDDVPVCILYMDADFSWVGQAKFLNMPGLDGFIRVKQYDGRYADEYRVLQDEIPYTIWIPSLWLTDGENNLIGYVPNDGNSRQWQAVLSQAKSVMKWKRSARKSLDNVEKTIEAGPFATILKTLDDVEEKDKKYTAAIRASYKAQPVDQLKSRLTSPDLFPGEKERIEQRVAKATQMFFHDRVRDLRKQALDNVDKTYARCEELLYGGSSKEALDTLKPLTGGKINPVVDKKIAALREKILTAMRTGETPKREGAAETPAAGTEAGGDTKAEPETKPETATETEDKPETAAEPETKSDDDKDNKDKDDQEKGADETP